MFAFSIVHRSTCAQGHVFLLHQRGDSLRFCVCVHLFVCSSVRLFVCLPVRQPVVHLRASAATLYFAHGCACARLVMTLWPCVLVTSNHMLACCVAEYAQDAIWLCRRARSRSTLIVSLCMFKIIDGWGLCAILSASAHLFKLGDVSNFG
jgi:hypothetical protein